MHEKKTRLIPFISIKKRHLLKSRCLSSFFLVDLAIEHEFADYDSVHEILEQA